MFEFVENEEGEMLYGKPVYVSVLRSLWETFYYLTFLWACVLRCIGSPI